MNIVEMSFYHLDVAARIEAACFSVPWSRAALAWEMNSGHTFFLAAIEGGEYAGYGCFSSVLGEGEIYRVAVLQEFRGKGVGAGLLDGMEKKARACGVSVLHLEVRESNAPARRLYASRGFSEDGRRPGYYRDPEESAVLMSKELTGEKNEDTRL